jgi:mRNA interferase RelE/StbE
VAYRVEFLEPAAKEFRELDRSDQRRITKKLEELAASEDPRAYGSVKRLSADDEVWRLRVGKYRVVFQIKDAELLITVVGIGNRDKIYMLVTSRL